MEGGTDGPSPPSLSDPPTGPAHPWDADRALDEAVVRAIVDAHDPGLAGGAIEPLGHGWDFDAYRAAQRVFRFPRRADVDADLDRRLGLGPLMAARLAPLGVSVPVVEHLGAPRAGFPYRYLVSRWVPGVDANAVPEADLELARALGRVLSVMHATDASYVAALDLPVETDAAPEWLAEAQALADTLPAVLGTELVRCLEWALSDPELPPEYGGPPRLIHNDLGPEHVIVDPGSGRLCGLLDWDDAAWGDPALDFVVLRAARGPEFTEAMLSTYELPLDPGFHERVSFMARVEALDWVHDAYLQGGDVDKHRRWVRHAFLEGP